MLYTLSFLLYEINSLLKLKNFNSKIKFLNSTNLNYPQSFNFLNQTEVKNHEISRGACSTEHNCFLPYGVCLNETACLCLPEYANIFVNEESVFQIKCTYKKKKLIIAGLLELFLPLSLGHFYAQQIKIGLFKFTYNLVVYSMCCILFSKSTEIQQGTVLICIIMSCLIPIWNIVDMFMFFTGFYKDGNGIPLS